MGLIKKHIKNDVKITGATLADMTEIIKNVSPPRCRMEKYRIQLTRGDLHFRPPFAFPDWRSRLVWSENKETNGELRNPQLIKSDSFGAEL